MSTFSEEDWRTILDLSERAAELPGEAQFEFLKSLTHVRPNIICEVLSLLQEFHPVTDEAGSRLGSRIGRFTITGYLGGGGVGDVYSAKDLELERTVALKFLKPSAVEQVGAGERFLQEARTASALNHPNIVTVHDTLRSESTITIVMEFVEGRSLRQACAAALPALEVAQIGRQIAQALTAAHAIGMIHRDIKPENAILRSDGSVKVLDFGLATWFSGSAERSSVSPSHLFAGTWRYMSPEQLRGEAVDAATDVYSLGLVLYELRNGQLPSEAVSAHDARLASWIGLFRNQRGARVQHALNRLIARMLAEDTSERPSASQAAETLFQVQEQAAAGFGQVSQSAVWVSLCCLVLVGLALVFRHFGGSADEPALPLLPLPLSVEPGSKIAPAFSPDGKRIAYAWRKPGSSTKIFLQNIDPKLGSASQPRRLTDLETEESWPIWSPDGRTIAFVHGDSEATSNVVLLDLQSGSQRTLTHLYGRLFQWTPDAKWLLAFEHSNTVLIPIEPGGKPQILTQTTGTDGDFDAALSPTYRLAFVHFFGDGLSRLAVLPLRQDYRPAGKTFFPQWDGFSSPQVADPTWTQGGRKLLFIANPDGVRRIWSSLDGKQPKLISELGENVSGLTATADGQRLAFIRNLDDTNIWKLNLKTAGPGREAPQTQVVSSSRLDQRPALSPNGRQLAFESTRSGFMEVWVADLQSGQTRRLTNLASSSGSPRWSPNGEWIVFDSRASGRPGIFKIAVSGGVPVPLTASNQASDVLPVWSADGKSIYFSSDRSGEYRIWQIPEAGGDAVQITNSKATAPEVSADGEFLYFLKESFVDSALWRKSLSSGKEELIAKNVFFRSVAVGKTRVYFCSHAASGRLNLYKVDPLTRRSERVAELSSSTVGGLSLSPNEQQLFFAQLDQTGDDLMLVDGFR